MWNHEPWNGRPNGGGLFLEKEWAIIDMCLGLVGLMLGSHSSAIMWANETTLWECRISTERIR